MVDKRKVTGLRVSSRMGKPRSESNDSFEYWGEALEKAFLPVFHYLKSAPKPASSELEFERRK